MKLIETCFLTSVVVYYKSVTLCGSTHKYENFGLMMWAITQNTCQKIMVNKTDYRKHRWANCEIFQSESSPDPI